MAARLLTGTATVDGPEEVDADEWLDHPDSSNYTIFEDSVRTGTGMVLSMLWWKDEHQILDLLKEEDGDAERPLSGHLSFKRRRG